MLIMSRAAPQWVKQSLRLKLLGEGNFFPSALDDCEELAGNVLLYDSAVY